MVTSKEEFNETVEKILNQSDYVHLRSSIRDFISSIKEKIADWILKLLKNKFSNMDDTIKISNTLSTVFMIIGIIIICAIIILIFVKINKSFEKRGKVKEILGEKINEDTTPAGLRKKAAVFEKQGDYRKAVRFDFISVLLLMHRKNIIYLDETKTNEEIYTYLTRKQFPVLDEFKYLSKSFNYYWYGHKSCNKETYSDWSNNIDKLWDEVMNYEKEVK